MKIIVKQSILDRAVAAVRHVQEQGRVVEEVLVTAQEMEEFLNCPIGSATRDDPLGRNSYFKDHELYVCDVRVRAHTPDPATEGHALRETILAPGVTVEGL